MEAEQVFLELGHRFIPDIVVLGYRVAMASTQEVEMLRRKFDELTAQMIEMRQQSRTHLAKTLTTGFHIQRIRVYARSCLSCLAENGETVTNSGDGDSTTRTAVCNIAVPPHDAHTEGSTKSGEKSWKQRFRSLQTTVLDVRNVRSGWQHGTIRANYDIQVRVQDRRRGRLSERISGTGETIRRGERYRSRSRPSEKGVHYLEHA